MRGSSCDKDCELSQVEERRTLKFAYLIEPPFNFRDSADKITGHDVDLAKHVFDELHIGQFEPIETEFAELLPGLADNRWRMTTGLFSTEERSKVVLFSRPIWALSDGLLVQSGNPLALTGYGSLANHSEAILAVIQDQFQHRSAVQFGVPNQRLKVFDTYLEAATAVRNGAADAYASVSRAHDGYIEQHPDWEVEIVKVPSCEKPPAFGCFAFALTDTGLRDQVDWVLEAFLGSDTHRRIASFYGFSNAEVDMLCGSRRLCL